MLMQPLSCFMVLLSRALQKFGNPIDERHCVNSKSVKFDAKK